MLLEPFDESAATGSNYVLNTPPEVTFFFLALLMLLVALSVFRKAGYLAMLISCSFAFFSAVFTAGLTFSVANDGRGLIYLIINGLVLIGYLAISRHFWKCQYENKREWV